MQHPTTDMQARLKQLGTRFSWQAIGPFAAVVALMILGTTINPRFLSMANLTNVFTTSAFIGIIAIGAAFIIGTGSIDLSARSIAAYNSD